MSFKLARVVGRGLPLGEPLPDVFPSLKSRGVRFYRGGSSLIGGTPGSMKTMFIGHLVDEMSVPTLYICNDTPEADIASRFIARRVREDSQDIRERILEDPDWGAGQLEDLEHIRWSFNPSPTLQDIEEEIMAFEELWGEFPHLLVVDIVKRVDYVEDGGGGLETIVLYLDTLAREANMHVMMAHHTSENMPGNPTQSKASFLEKITKTPALALTCATDGEHFYVSPVKNRAGWSDSKGEEYFTFVVDAPTAVIEEI